MVHKGMIIVGILESNFYFRPNGCSLTANQMPEKMDSNYFGFCLADLRRKRRLRQKQVAAASDLDCSYIAALENGRRVPPRDGVMTRLSEALGLSDAEKSELRRTAVLSEIGRAMLQHADELTGINAALSILEISAYLSEEELRAIETLMDGYRYRAHVQGGKAM